MTCAVLLGEFLCALHFLMPSGELRPFYASEWNKSLSITLLMFHLYLSIKWRWFSHFEIKDSKRSNESWEKQMWKWICLILIESSGGFMACRKIIGRINDESFSQFFFYLRFHELILGRHAGEGLSFKCTYLWSNISGNYHENIPLVRVVVRVYAE